MKRQWLLCFMSMLLVVVFVDCGPQTPAGNEAVESSGDSGALDVLPTEQRVSPEPRVTPPDATGKQEPTPEPPVRPEPPVHPEPPVRPEPPVVPDAAPPEPPPVTESPADTPTTPEVDTKWLSQVSCASTPPAGATLAAAPPKYTGGTCPNLKAGINTIASTFGGKSTNRKFILVLPSNIQPNETFPVLFLWHWLKGDANKFLVQGDIQKAADQQRFIGIIPESKKDLSMVVVDIPWPFISGIPQSRFEEEYVFFDDMLSCVSNQFKVNKECVSSAGVSAGALFTAQLASARSQYLSSFLSLSGGVNESAGVIAKVPDFKSTKHKMPALVLWGGPSDSCVLLNFEKASKKLEARLKQDGHFFLECVHNCKHAEPPITALPGKSRYEALWGFFLRHPFWLKAGQSPFQVIKWPYSNVPWCGIGAGSATPRTGTCGDPACPI